MNEDEAWTFAQVLLRDYRAIIAHDPKSGFCNLGECPFKKNPILEEHDRCVASGNSNPSLIRCDTEALNSISKASVLLHSAIGKKNVGKDAHGRDLSLVTKYLASADEAFASYLENECIVKVYTGGAGTASDNIMMVGECKFSKSLRRLLELESIAK